MKNKQTAVEFIEKGMEESGLLLDHKWLVDLIEQAKQMEKEQIMLGITKHLPIENGVITAVQRAEQYYNETYEK